MGTGNEATFYSQLCCFIAYADKKLNSKWKTKAEGRKYEGSKYEGRKYEGRKYEGRKYEGRKYEGSKYEGNKYEGRKYEGRKYEGRKYKGRKYEGRKYEGRMCEGRMCERRMCSTKVVARCTFNKLFGAGLFLALDSTSMRTEPSISGKKYRKSANIAIFLHEVSLFVDSAAATSAFQLEHTPAVATQHMPCRRSNIKNFQYGKIHTRHVALWEILLACI